jgi:hypothetical protein
MECLVLLGLPVIVGMIIAASTQSAVQFDPRRIGDDVARALASGNTKRSRDALQKLPDWAVRQGLIETAERTTELRRNLGVATAAGVPATVVQQWPDKLGHVEETMVAIARKVAALGTQAKGNYKTLDQASRALVDVDVRRLESIRRATGTALLSLERATAAIDSSDAERRADALEALGRSLRELSEG